MDATIRKDKRIAAGTQRRLWILIRNKKDINLVPAQSCQLQPHTQQPAWQGWQGTSIATRPSSPPGVALFQSRSTRQQPSWGSSTKTQPLLGQENPWQERCGKQSRRRASLESQLALAWLVPQPRTARQPSRLPCLSAPREPQPELRCLTVGPLLSGPLQSWHPKCMGSK